MASPAVADPTAVTARRVVATLIDGAVIIGPTVAIATSNMEYITRERVGSRFDDFCDDYMDQLSGTCLQVGDRAYFSDSAADPGGSFAFFGLSLVLLVVLQGLTGWTVGKLLMGLRTVREDGTPPGILKAFVRWVLLLVDGLPCIPLVGFICALTTQGHRRVGDMAAKTFVVGARSAGQPIVVPGLTGPPIAPAMYGTPPPSPGWPSPAAPSSAPPSPSVGAAPQWDAARGTYIQWDAAGARWLQWDETTRAWSPIPGQ
ncbi:MAG: RDD family protein [Acidimicrobiales bacterium]